MTTTAWMLRFNQMYSSILDRNSNGPKRGLAKNLYNRARGFEWIFSSLLKKKVADFYIVETGTVRTPNNWKDGNSGFLFSEFVKHHGGFVKSVDIDKNAVDTANDFIGNDFYRSYCEDSITWLSKQPNLKNVDLFYLDSKDVIWSNDRPSAEHHLQEFLVLEPFIKPGALVAIDDNNFKITGERTGKGRMIVEYLQGKNIFPVYDEYQIIYEF